MFEILDKLGTVAKVAIVLIVLFVAMLVLAPLWWFVSHPLSILIALAVVVFLVYYIRHGSK